MAAAASTLPAVRLLGPIEVVGPHGPAQLTGARQRGLVGLLALNAGAMVAQSRLVDALWGEDPPRTAVRSLHSHVSRVRHALQACGLGDVLLPREPGYRPALDRDQVDVFRFEDEVRAADGAAEPAGPLRAALALWRGDPLADGEPAGWAVAEVERLHEARLTAVERLWDAELQTGRHAAAVGELERELVGRPGRERLVGLLMLALYRCDRHADALDRYERLRARLADELGVDPGPWLQQLHTAILRRDPALDARPVQPPARPPAPRDQPTGTGTHGTGTTGVNGALGAAGVTAPAQLPPPVGHFAGRQAELLDLDAWHRARGTPAGPDNSQDDGPDNSQDGGPGGGPGDGPGDGTADRIVVVSGPAGVGKTAFAVQWAHQARSRFPDGQVYLDLRGHDPDSALTPDEALTHVLRALGVPADRIPADLAEQTALYRSLVNDRRLLVLLDNGGTADHVLPLVPGTDASVLVVTSRNQLAALAVHHGVRAVRLDVFSPVEGLALLTRVLGADRVERAAGAAAELVQLCGRLPLALRIAAAKLAARPRQDIAELVAELSGGDRLDALAVDGAHSVRAVFASAYAALSEPAARLFRLLGLHPGGHFTSHIAAALTGLSYGRARRSVDELAAAHLITETASGRYRCHDLVRLYARECADDEETADQRRAAVERIVDWYLAAADAANRTLDPARDRVRPVLRHPVPDPPFEPRPDAVLTFLDGEQENLAPVVEYAAKHDQPVPAWQLTYLLAGYFESRGHWADRLAVGRWGLGAAQAAGDRAAEGLMRSGLGVACIAARHFDEALDHLHHALAIMRSIGDRRGEGHAHNNLAAAYAELRRFDEAVEEFGEALAVHTANGHRAGTALALNNLGYTLVRLGETEAGLTHLRRGLTMAGEDRNTRMEAAILHSIGQAYRHAGDQPRALEHFTRALALRRQIGDRRNTASTVHEIGLTQLAGGDLAAAAASFAEARAVAAEIADRHLETVALASSGRRHLLAGDLAAARAELEHALALRTAVPDWYEEASLHRWLGDLERGSGRDAEARDHWERASELYRKAKATGEANQLAGSLAAASSR